MKPPQVHSEPLVTVLLPVHNAAPFLQAALDSILAQTFTDFELLAIDDGSTDGSSDLLAGCTDPRLRVIRHTANHGLIASLNEGLEAARGRYIARMDADDVMLPHRLEKQVAFLEAEPHVAVVAALVETINTDGEVVGSWDTDRATPDEPTVAAMLPRTNCIAHPTVMLRRSALGDLRYDPRQPGAEDWDMWLRMLSRGLRITKLPEVLLRYRQHVASTMGREKEATPYELRMIRIRRRFLLGEWRRLHFSRVQPAVIQAQARTWGRYLRYTLWPALARGLYRRLTYSSWGIVREQLALRKAERSWRGRTAIFIPYLHTGGAEQVHADIVAAVEDQHPLVVVSGFSTDRAFSAELARHATLLELPRSLNHPGWQRRTQARLAALINAREAPTVLGALSATFFDLLPLLRPAIPAFHLQHAFLYQPDGNRQHTAWLRHFPRVNGYVFVSGQARKEFERFLFAHHVPRSQFGKLHLITNAVHHFGSVRTHDRMGLLFVGRDSEEKRLPLFLSVCDALEAERPGRFRFTVVGAETRPGHAHVQFAGRVNDAERMAALYANHDLLVLTSFREGFPLVVQEAMAQGLAVLATPVGDIPNRLDAGCSMVTSHTEEASVLQEMTVAALALDADRSRLQAMKAAALAKALAEYGPERFREAYRALLIAPSS